jgi:nucleoside triphosphate diphosphatase
VDNNGAKKTLPELIAVMAALRTPGTGCPWDLEQTFATIAPYTIEEAYEVADAIAKNDIEHLKDELGDLLFQVVYHARIAQEQDAFAFDDVIDAIATKMIRRHPHVFGTPEERAAGVTPGFWDRAKATERAGKPPAGVLDDVPIGLPALTRAIKLQNKAAKVGFDWPSLQPVLAKLKEELAEFEAEIAEHGVRPGGSDTGGEAAVTVSDPPGLTPPPNAAAIEEEFGDLLFVLANVARHLKLDAEGALRGANEKFVRRFRYIEEQLAERGRTPEQSGLAEMDALWDEAKTKGR